MLSGPPGTPYRVESTKYLPLLPLPALELGAELPEASNFYGFDLGVKDEDIDNNDDMNAISGMPPISRESTDVALDCIFEYGYTTEFGFGVQSSTTNGNPGGYYGNAVPIRIPYGLEPLPSKYATVWKIDGGDF
jgi:hypothetical protein